MNDKNIRQVYSPLIINTPQKSNIAMLLFLFYTLLASVAIAAIMLFFFDGKISPVVLALNHTITFLLPLAVYMLITKQKLSEVMPLSDLSISNFFLIIGMAITIQPLMMFLSGISLFFAENDVSTLMQQLNQDYTSVLINLVVIALIPALMEEFFFRGFLLNGYRKVKVLSAALINGLFFGIMHLNLQQFLYAFVLGIIFTYLVHYTKSVFAPIIAHFAINGTQTVLSFALLQMQNSMSPELLEVAQQTELSLWTTMLYYFIFALFITPLFVALFYMFIKRNKKNSIPFLQERFLCDEHYNNTLPEIIDIERLQNGEVIYKPVENPPQHPANIAKPKRLLNWSFWGVVLFYVVYMALMQFLANIQL